MDANLSISSKPAVMVRGNAAMAPGQLAKAAVAEARTAGIDLPKNAQGLAASQIAKGADPASIFAAAIAPVDPVENPDPTAPEDPDVAPIADDTAVPAAPSDVEIAYDSAVDVLGGDAQTSAEVALDLLS